jgi:hypothetical protein
MQRFAAAFVPLLILALVPSAWAQIGRRHPTSQPAAKTETPKAGAPEEAIAEATRQTLPEPAAFVPADALFYLGINDIGDTWHDLQQTSEYSLMKEATGPAALPSLSRFGESLSELKTRLAKALGVSPDQLGNPLAGPVALFITAPFGAKAEEVEPGLVAGVGDAALMKTYYDAALAKLTARGKHETVSAGSDTIDVFTVERDEKKAGAAEDAEFDRLDAGERGLARPDELLKRALGRLLAGESLPPKLALCLTADRVIVAGSAEYVEAILRHESTKTVADTDDYKALLQNLKPTGDIRFVVNLPRIMEMIPAAAEASEAKDLRRKIRAWGLDSLGSLVGHCRIGAASYDWKVEALLLLSDNRAGLVKLLGAENQPAAPPADVTADTCVWATWNVDVPSWLDELASGLFQWREAPVRGAAPSWMERKLPSGETVNLRAAFFDYLRGPLTFSFGIGQASGTAGVHIFAAIGQSDQAAVTKFLGGPVVQDFLEAREVRGTQVFDFKQLPPVGTPGLSVAVTPERLVVGNTAAVEGALAPAPSDTAAESETWKRVARYVPEQAWLTLFVDYRKLLDSLAELAKKPQEAPAAGADVSTAILAFVMQGLGSGAGGELGGLDRLRRYAAQTVYTIASTPQGVQFTAVQLRP